MYKTLLLPYVNEHSEKGPLAAAISLTEQCAGNLVIVVTTYVPTPFMSEWEAVHFSVYEKQQRDARAQSAAIADRLRKRVSKSGISVEVRTPQSLRLTPSHSAAMEAHYADLTILPSAPAGPSGALADRFFVDLLMDSGRPVLVVPPEFRGAQPAAHVVVAWKPTREASRAIQDAMPMLLAAGSIDVLMIDPEVSETAHGEEPGADIAAYLARHNLSVRVVNRSQSGSITEAIVEHAQLTNAGLIVAGGCGHPRLREWIVGSDTRQLLQNMRVPVLFAH